MRQDKHKAISLRQKGKSYQEICQVLKIPKSTLSYWLKDVTLSLKAKQRLQKRVNETSIAALIKRNIKQTELALLRANAIRKKAAQSIGKIRKKDLFLLGIALYWGEGYKRGKEKGVKWKCVDFTNSDPAMISVMMHFFREICGVLDKKFCLYLALHSKKQEKEAQYFWSKLTGIPKKQFIKTSFQLSKSSKKIRPKTRLPYGTLHIRIQDVKLFFQVIGWIDGVQEQLKFSRGVVYR